MSRASFTRTVLLAALLGVLVGLFGSAFYVVWHHLNALVWERFTNPVNRIWISGLAGLIIGGIITRLRDPGTMGEIIGHFHHQGKLPYADNLPIIPASLVGLVGGASAGPEGVLTQVCGTIGTWVAERIGGPELLRVLTQAGMGAGFGAFLGSPVGGAILWLEMPHKEGLEYYESLIPTLTSSVVGYLVMALLLDVNLTPTWHPGAVLLSTPADLWRALAVGVAAGGAALLYSYLFRGVGKAFAALPIPLWVTTTLAGLVIGTLGAVFPLTYFYGRNQVDALIAGSFPLMLLVGMLLAKMIAASVTIGGHWQGGLIIPHMFMGAVVGKLLALAIPGVGPALAIVTGMAAFNAAATHTPLASALIVIALTGTGGAIPVFLASLVGFFIGQWVELIGGKRHRSDLPSGGDHAPEDFHLPVSGGDQSSRGQQAPSAWATLGDETGSEGWPAEPEGSRPLVEEPP